MNCRPDNPRPLRRGGRGNAGKSTMYKHILIATDGSELAGKAVLVGLTLAKQLNCKVTAVTVSEPGGFS